jgi:CheY-like chemotaxis protein
MQGTSTRKQILIIDPDASLAKSLLYDTYDSLIEVTIACNSLAGLTLVKEIMPDVVLIGSQLSGIECYEVVRKLRSFAPTTQVPIALFSGLPDLSQIIGIAELKQHSDRQQKRSRQQERIATILKWSSSSCAIAGGILLASNISISGFGFIGLATSSFQMLLASCLLADKTMVVYSGALFIFVDCLGVFRWLIL